MVGLAFGDHFCPYFPTVRFVSIDNGVHLCNKEVEVSGINDILSRLNERHEEVTDLIPDRRVFVDDFTYAKNEYGESINDQPLGNQFYRLSSGKYIWVGIDGAGNNKSKNVRRYNSDLTLDETFVCPDFDSSDNGYVRGVVEQADGKIVVVGHFNTVGGVTANKIARLNLDGSLDQSFNSGTGFDGNCLVVLGLPSGRILVGGSFNNYNGNGASKLARLNSDGTLDGTYLGFNGNVHALLGGAGGKTYVGGQFNKKLVRLNGDGSVDNSFGVGTGFNNRVSSLALDPSGKLMVGGWFNQYKESPCNPGVVRLEANGDLDSSFATEGSGLNTTEGIVQTLAVQSDGKVVAGGWFNQYDGNRQGHIIRFNADGTKDASFVVGYGFVDHGDWDGRVQHLSVTESGDFLCVGGFIHYNGSALYGFAKLNSSGDIQPERLFKYPFSVGMSDGWEDMYDGGNYINTNLTQLFADVSGDSANEEMCIPYTHSAAFDESVFEDLWNDEGIPYAPVMDGVVRSGDDYFGEGSHYFTNMYPGMLVMVATGVNIEEFSITGDLGSDGSSQNESSILVVHEGSEYTVFKKVNRQGSGGEGSGDPSVNHLIIVPGDPTGLTQLVNESGDDYDDHCVQGLSGRRALAYLLIARHTDEQAGDWLSDSDAEAIVVKFLDVIGGLSSTQTYTYDLSPQWVRQVGEGSMDTAIVVEEGVRRSIQRSVYVELVDADGNRKVEEARDGETISDAPEVPEATNVTTGHPTFGANDVPSIVSQVIPVGNPLASSTTHG